MSVVGSVYDTLIDPPVAAPDAPPEAPPEADDPDDRDVGALRAAALAALVDPTNPTSPDHWTLLRAVDGELAHSAHVRGWYDDALKAIAHLLPQCGTGTVDEGARDGAGTAVLEVGAGTGFLAALVQRQWPALVYHATEQTPAGVAGIGLAAVDLDRACVGARAAWRCEPDSGPLALREALERAGDVFLPHYDLVVLHHVLDCVAWPVTYKLLDACWEMVRPYDAAAGRSGFLLVGVQRHLVHRVHPVEWSWDTLVGHLAQYSRPVLAYEGTLAGGLLAAVWRPPDGTPRYPAPGELRP